MFPCLSIQGHPSHKDCILPNGTQEELQCRLVLYAEFIAAVHELADFMANRLVNTHERCEVARRLVAGSVPVASGYYTRPAPNLDLLLGIRDGTLPASTIVLAVNDVVVDHVAYFERKFHDAYRCRDGYVRARECYCDAETVESDREFRETVDVWGGVGGGRSAWEEEGGAVRGSAGEELEG